MASPVCDGRGEKKPLTELFVIKSVCYTKTLLKKESNNFGNC